ncbi:uncharacterized protein BO87DRAFT_412788 [Aspergillus neoniger CBS 115656]|uniref:Uncharacterized protein n=1 Tax=Aspergillus neoniger (strain CBS 115656) TaxID=1448310 RepID=A0A318YV22_ASPNB|nr:hypothetical protein BO87DRAFT_412788 [Aspergillus neoniger CBS 115656]PYH38144.1 hypothetical protein BO87DRAFT_412788 [Aspergillus neoniger CBS 115656]
MPKSTRDHRSTRRASSEQTRPRFFTTIIIGHLGFFHTKYLNGTWGSQEMMMKEMCHLKISHDIWVTTDYDSLISDPQAIRYVAKFMLQTGLLGQFSRVELDPDPDLDPSQEHVGLRAMGIGAEDAG